MTTVAAKRLMKDLGKNLTQDDYIENVCVSVNGVVRGVYKDCACFESDGYTFIWTREDSFLIDGKKLGRYVILQYNPSIKVALNKTVL
jgi:hypothetical protein